MVLLLLLALTTVGAISCKGDGKNPSDSVETADLNQESANLMIESSNKFLDLSRKRNGNIDRTLNYTEHVADYISGKRTAIKPNLVLIPIISTSAFNKKEVNLADAFGCKKDEVAKLHEETNTKFKLMTDKTAELKSYIDAEDFKDDKGEKAKTLIAEIETAIEEYFTANASLLSLTQPMADKAEEVILKDHPLKDYIIGAKKAMNSVEESYSQVADQYNNEALDLAALKASYAEIEKISNALKKDFSVTDTNYTDKKGYYENFTKAIEDYLGELRKNLRNIEEKKKIELNDVESIERAYDNTISKYNNFVS
ncbi:Protein of unknown function [Paenimyroides ummariense]|uniref:DUF3829 domain-containing protein n=2 Tax=Paenimyroides ummariense TaxID=913024 RepID=A0A1I4W2R2_9FLAO|nr:Protein of unknown function [Paenimyroides ummariense]